MFVTSVGTWIAADENISLVPDALMAVNAAAGETVTLSALNIASGTKGSVDWGDGTKEPFSNEGTKSSVAEDKITLSHQYVNAFEGEAKIFVQEGSISGEVNAAEYDKITINDKTKVNVKKLFVFTVNDSGKKVKFSPGNLYWDGSEFKFEEHQYDYPTIWDTKHVGHFFWSKLANVAVASSYSDIGRAIEDIFFASEGGAIAGWTMLSKDEWKYLFEHSMAKNSSDENLFSIRNLANGLIFLPDDFNGNLKDTYTASEWDEVAAEYGFTFIPATEIRMGNTIITDYTFPNKGMYWTGTPDTGSELPGLAGGPEYAYYAEFRTGSTSINVGSITSSRNNGYPVRLVQVVE